MPINRKAGETEDQFISRCIADEIRSGKENDVAAAICYSYLRRENMKGLRTAEERVAAKLKYNNDFRGINLTNFGENSDACWENYIQVGTKIVDGREVPDCRGPVEAEDVMPQIDSTYPGEAADDEKKKEKMEIEEPNLNIFGYHTRNFDLCPSAVELFKHLVQMPITEEGEGMIRSLAQIADNVFKKEREVIEAGVASAHDLQEAGLLVADFKDLIHEIDEEVGMVHDVSFMDGHIKTISEYRNGNE